MKPENPINIAAQNIPPTQPPSVIPQAQSSHAPPQPNFVTSAQVTAAATTGAAVTGGYVAHLESLKLKQSISKVQQEALSETFDTCSKDPNYKISDAIYKLQLANTTDEQIIYCLKKVGRLDDRKHYTIQNGEAVDFVKVEPNYQVVDVNNPNNKTLDKINTASESVLSMRAKGKQMVRNASEEDKPSLILQQHKVEVAAEKALTNLLEVGVEVANPQLEDTTTSVNQALANLDTVAYVVNERDAEAKTLLNERKSETSVSPRSSIRTNQKYIDSSSSKMASVGNPFYPKEKQKHCSIGQCEPVVPSMDNPYVPLARGLFALAAVSGCLYLFLSYFSWKNDTKQRKESQQYFDEKQRTEEKEFSDIIIVLKESNFLNILHKYKMQKITLKEVKILLSTNFGLKENQILSILNCV